MISMWFKWTPAPSLFLYRDVHCFFHYFSRIFNSYDITWTLKEHWKKSIVSLGSEPYYHARYAGCTAKPNASWGETWQCQVCPESLQRWHKGHTGLLSVALQPERIGCWGKEALFKDLKNNICLNQHPNHKGLNSLNGMEIHLEVRPVLPPPSTCPLCVEASQVALGTPVLQVPAVSALLLLRAGSAFTALTQKLLQNFLVLWHETVPDTHFGSIGSRETPKGM